MPECRVKFTNVTSEGRIERTLAVFNFSDGSTISDPPNGEPGEANIGPGEAGYRFARPGVENKCVKSIFAFMIWESGSGGENWPPPPIADDECWTEVGLELGYQSFVRESITQSGPYFKAVKIDPRTGAKTDISNEVPEEFKQLVEKYKT